MSDLGWLVFTCAFYVLLGASFLLMLHLWHLVIHGDDDYFGPALVCSLGSIIYWFNVLILPMRFSIPIIIVTSLFLVSYLDLIFPYAGIFGGKSGGK